MTLQHRLYRHYGVESVRVFISNLAEAPLEMVVGQGRSKNTQGVTSLYGVIIKTWLPAVNRLTSYILERNSILRIGLSLGMIRYFP